MWKRNDRRAPASRITPSTTFESYFGFAGRQANVPSGKFNGCSTCEDSSGFALSLGSIYFLALRCGRPAEEHPVRLLGLGASAITKQAADCRLQATGEPDNHLKRTKL